MTPHNLVAEVGLRLHTPLVLDNNGLARIMVDEIMPVDFEFDQGSGKLIVYSVVGMLAAGATRESFFEELLAANLFGVETGTCSPALDRERNEMLLWFSVDEEASVDGVLAMLENLIGRTEQWRARLAGMPSLAMSDGTAPENPARFEVLDRA